MSLLKLTVVPGNGTPDKVTTPDVLVPPTRLLRFNLTPTRVTAETVRIAVLVTDANDVLIVTLVGVVAPNVLIPNVPDTAP